MSEYILGISCFYHDSAATLIKDGEILTAVQEERFTRKKHDSRFPKNAINYCLDSNGLYLKDIRFVVYYEKPFLTFKRLFKTYLTVAPRGLNSFLKAMNLWLGGKLFLRRNIKKNLEKIRNKKYGKKNKLPQILFVEHHQSHAGSAFFPSPFEKALILCLDGVGESVTTSTWIGNKNQIKPLWHIDFPHSIGLLYSAFTFYCGFKVNSGEYKLMGLAPYGEPIYVDKIKNNLIDIKEDGTFKLNIEYFEFHRGSRMTSDKFHKLFNAPPRKRESDILKFHMDLAASIQNVTEEVVIKIAKTLKKETGINNICLSGGVALNCVANGKLLKRKIFNEIWIQPASGDSGSSLGAALFCWYQYLKNPRTINPNDSMKGSYLGCSFNNKFIIEFLKKKCACFEVLEDEDLFKRIAFNIDRGKIVGWFDGPMEFGPRALGNRSIIADPRNKKMQKIMNLKIKNRESFRPFAPSVLNEDLQNIFQIIPESPYMLFVSQLNKEICKPMNANQKKLFGIDQLNVVRSSLPAITHIDYSARVQSVNKKTNRRYYKLIEAFKE
ncbi:putative nodulation protein [Prochlorococcus marinus str. MIT 9202]|nr:putative nodulation protein [Prochlorococcus marinus str. MIT 9202]